MAGRSFLNSRSKLWIEPERVSRGLLEREELHVVTFDTLPEVGHLGQGDHDMAIGRSRHVIDQIDHAVLEATDVEPEDDMGDERTPVADGSHRASIVCCRAVSIAGAAAWMNASRVAAASRG
jgi:hypothetical protein